MDKIDLSDVICYILRTEKERFYSYLLHSKCQSVGGN